MSGRDIHTLENYLYEYRFGDPAPIPVVQFDEVYNLKGNHFLEWTTSSYGTFVNIWNRYGFGEYKVLDRLPAMILNQVINYGGDIIAMVNDGGYLLTFRMR